MAKKITYKANKVDRRFTKDWAESGAIRADKLPQLMASALEQRKSMIEYIEALHDALDRVLDVAKTCDACSGILTREGVRFDGN